MPKINDFPIPKKRYHGGRWRIFWYWNRKQYSVATSHLDPKKTAGVDSDLRLVSAALAMETPAFPEPYDNAQAVKDYLANRAAQSNSSLPAGDWLEAYEPVIKSECSEKWAKFSLDVLKKFESGVIGLERATPDIIVRYLAEIAEKSKPATRNRVQNIFSRFFNWAVRTRRIKVSPAAGIKRIAEERGADIVHCTPAEREEILAMALESGWEDWLAIPVAFYTGMRREEVSRLDWDDVRFSKGLVVIQKSKTGKSRVLPLSTALEKILLEIPEERRSGPVVVTPPEIDRLLRLDNLVRHLRRMKRDRLLAAWGMEKPLPSRAMEYRERLAKWKAAMKSKTRELDAALERIGWNSFRHTFGSLLAQAGVSLDKISAWMGNTPEVCRRHYAQFIPRDRRDEEIDKL